MKVNLVFLVFILSVFSCSENEGALTPQVLLSKKEMVNVIVDVQLLESHYHNKYQRPNVYANALDSASQVVFKKHKISKQIFKENLIFYAINQDSLYSIYETVLDTVNNKINSTIVK